MKSMLKLTVGASIMALTTATAAWAQDAVPTDGTEPTDAGDIVVTGSRVATTGADAPTPITIVTTEALAKTTPSNIPDGLNKLPVFQGSATPRRAITDGTLVNSSGNTLALRGFGSQRTLVLLDGHRVTPSNYDGTVSPDILPQMLVQRVDVVTGGASAVYGSDAVTGIVNFVLDKKFEGLKLNVNGGISTYGDGESYRIGAAYGTSLFGDRGHFIASYERYHRQPVSFFDRPYGPGVNVLTGSGSAANPFTPSANVRRADYSFGGKITSVAGCASPCALTAQQFVSNGVLGAFVTGTVTGTGNQVVGGDGSYSEHSTALVGFTTDQAYARFQYDVSDDVNFYVSGSYARQTGGGTWFPSKLTPVNSGATASNSNGATFFKNNPFLSSTVQTALGNNGLFDSSNVFSIGKYDHDEYTYTRTKTENENYNINVGFNGNLGRFRWDLFYSHGQNTLHAANLTNLNQQKLLAAADAVQVGNTIQCYAATQAATAAQYAGCVPLNPFGPTAATRQMFDWYAENVVDTVKNGMDNVGGSIAGDLFDGWAGPFRGALSAEYRKMTYQTSSTAPANRLVDCTGLRICNPGLSLYAGGPLAPVRASNEVWEVAAELNAPLLSDKAFAKSLILNLAGRHTNYSTSGGVNTWKIGAIWEVSDELRFRITRSVDIRAPTLDDLFRPGQTSSGIGFDDTSHTGLFQVTNVVSRGNPDLKPEKANTLTFGVVLQPHFIPGLTLSADYYHIKLDNAITLLSGQNRDVYSLCEASGGTSVYCSLYDRPLPFSDKTAANYPTAVRSQLVNAAFAEVKGVDIELAYNKGPFNLRVFANYQPVNRSQQFPGAPIVEVVGAKTRITATASYAFSDSFRIGVQDNWLSSFKQASGPVTAATNNYVVPRIGSFNTFDLNIEKDFKAASADFTAYLAVQNLFNANPPLAPFAGGVGIYYPVPINYDIMGRYFTVGLRLKM